MGDFQGHPFRGNQWTDTAHVGDASTARHTIASERISEVANAYRPDVHADGNGDGVTDAARVGVGGHEVPPPPQVPRLPRLTPRERAVESAFATAYEKDPEGFARKYRDMMAASGVAGRFEVDAAKNLFEPWAGKGIPESSRAQLRATMNTALHQTANAITKRAFLQHLNDMPAAERAKGLLVTVGGCGAGKGFALKTLGDQMPELNSKSYGAVWDSAGDQNATENPWLLKEAKERGIPVTFVYVSADPHISWADPKRGVVQRARDPRDGRMVDAQVFADSYVIGAQNHAVFASRHTRDATFVYLKNGSSVERVNGVPDEDLQRSRTKLHAFAVGTVSHPARKIPRHIRRGALVGQRIW